MTVLTLVASVLRAYLYPSSATFPGASVYPSLGLTLTPDT